MNRKQIDSITSIVDTLQILLSAIEKKLGFMQFNAGKHINQ